MEAAVAINGACEVKTNMLGFDGSNERVREAAASAEASSVRSPHQS